MPDNAEAMCGSNLPQERFYSAMLEFNDLVTGLTDQMLVPGVAVVMVVNGPRADLNGPEHAGVDKLTQCAVDGRPADALTSGLEIVNELVGVEMRMLAKDVSNEVAHLPGEALGVRPTCQILPKFLFGRLRHFHSGQRHGEILCVAGEQAFFGESQLLVGVVGPRGDLRTDAVN